MYNLSPPWIRMLNIQQLIGQVLIKVGVRVRVKVKVRMC